MKTIGKVQNTRCKQKLSERQEDLGETQKPRKKRVSKQSLSTVFCSREVKGHWY